MVYKYPTLEKQVTKIQKDIINMGWKVSKEFPTDRSNKYAPVKETTQNEVSNPGSVDLGSSFYDTTQYSMTIEGDQAYDDSIHGDVNMYQFSYKDVHFTGKYFDDQTIQIFEHC